jgi:glycine oxidase
MVMSRSPQKIRILGAGVAGLTAAYEFAAAGQTVEIVERQAAPGLGCSHFAGGMLAPWCEAESAPPLVVEWGLEGLAFWSETLKLAKINGSLLVAPARDRADLLRFSRRTCGFEWLDADQLAMCEPHLAGRFDRALFFPGEAHLDPRAAIDRLVQHLRDFPRVSFRFDTAAEDATEPADWIIDCRGFAAKDRLADLRGVKGEMLVVKTDEVSFERPVQLLHPRHPVYVVPRGDGRFMVGATAIENEERPRVTARSMLELLSAVYALHPAFGEAEIVETGADLRPAFPDNMPRIRREGRTIFINGLYRHGFLLAPALARRAVAVALKDETFPEVMDANPRQRQSA